MGTEIIQSQDVITPIFHFSAQNPVACYLQCMKAKALKVLVPSSFFNLGLPFPWVLTWFQLNWPFFPKDIRPTRSSGPSHLLFLSLENVLTCALPFSHFIQHPLTCHHLRKAFPDSPPHMPFWTCFILSPSSGFVALNGFFTPKYQFVCLLH